ncbi:MAG: hypothetical protein HEEMFOPI_00323 [Holosporales bacterium]
MRVRFLKSIKALIKVEKAKISELQPSLSSLMHQILEREEKIKELDETLAREKNFLSNETLSIDFINFFNRIEKEKNTLNVEKENFLNEYEKIHTQMMEHVQSERSYNTISDRLKNTLIQEQEKREFETIEDIIQMRKINL